MLVSQIIAHINSAINVRTTDRQPRILIASAAGGPLLQKSSHVATLSINNENKNMTLAATLNHVDLGTVSSLASPAKFDRSEEFSIALQEYFSVSTMTTNDPCQVSIVYQAWSRQLD